MSPLGNVGLSPALFLSLLLSLWFSTLLNFLQQVPFLCSTSLFPFPPPKLMSMEEVADSHLHTLCSTWAHVLDFLFVQTWLFLLRFSDGRPGSHRAAVPGGSAEKRWGSFIWSLLSASRVPVRRELQDVYSARPIINLVSLESLSWHLVFFKSW